MIDNTIQLLITFTGSGVAGFFMGVFMGITWNIRLLAAYLTTILGMSVIPMQTWRNITEHIPVKVKVRLADKVKTWDVILDR